MKRCNIKAGEKKASALSYNPDEGAPRIAASGRGREAERIIAIAREAGVEVVEDPVLAELLDGSYPGDYVPLWCWEAVAKILAFVLAKERQ